MIFLRAIKIRRDVLFRICYLFEPDDSINAFLRIKGLDDETFLDSHYVVFATKQGIVKKTSLRAYSRPRTNGVIAININEGDEWLMFV